MTIGERIKERRLELGYSVNDLAHKLGINRATVYRYESDEISSIPYRVMNDIAKSLNTTPAELYGISDSPDLSPLSSDETHLIETFRTLSAEGREYIRNQLNIASVMYPEKNHPAVNSQIG